MAKEILEIINEENQVIGKDTRVNIHTQGLLHREIHVWFYCVKNKSLIWQKRSAEKDTFPNLLDATVGGHVDLGSDFLHTAIKESFEETGISIQEKDLHFVKNRRSKSFDKVTKMTNNVIRAIFVYNFLGDVQDLKVEDSQGVGFIEIPLEIILSSDEESIGVIPEHLNVETLEIFRDIQKGKYLQ